jgi:glycosyltransferase involved in cell wall biosynthesis
MIQYWLCWAVWMLAILYPSFVYLLAARHLKNHQPPAGDELTADGEGVSVIVCAHNEANNLRELLPLLYRQHYKPLEIIVVDDRSTDDTALLLHEQKKEESRLRSVWVKERPEHVRGKKFALSLGIRKARYDKILLTDADCRPQSDHWVGEMASWLRGSKLFVLGFSPYYYRPGWLNAFIRYETLHTALLYLGAALAGRPYMAVGRNLAYRKSFFLEKKGFRGHWHINGGDDDLWVNRHADAKNSCVSLSERTKVYSIPKERLPAYLRQKKRHLHVGKYYRKKDKLWLGALSFSEVMSYLLLLPLILMANEPYTIMLGFVLKWYALLTSFKTAVRKFNESLKPAHLPILNILYVIYLVQSGTRALFSKNTRWS